jgi:CheY-like chemotaxis protein
MKVLILEDFFYRAKQFKNRFVSFGITDITHVTRADECIRHISEIKYDIIFLDYHLNNMEFEVLAPDNTGAKVVGMD